MSKHMFQPTLECVCMCVWVGLWLGYPLPNKHSHQWDSVSGSELSHPAEKIQKKAREKKSRDDSLTQEVSSCFHNKMAIFFGSHSAAAKCAIWNMLLQQPSHMQQGSSIWKTFLIAYCEKERGPAEKETKWRLQSCLRLVVVVQERSWPINLQLQVLYNEHFCPVTSWPQDPWSASLNLIYSFFSLCWSLTFQQEARVAVFFYSSNLN